MSAASNHALSQLESFGKRLRHLAVGVLFVLVLLVPKILHARRNPRSWMLLRIFLGVAGAALVILPLGAWSSYAPAIAGLTMFDFQRLRRSTDMNSAPLIAASIFLDALNVFLFFLNIFGRGRD